MLRKSVNLFLFLGIISILFASPLASGNAFAADKDKDKKTPPPQDNCASLGSVPEILECLKKAGEDAFSKGTLNAIKKALALLIDLVTNEAHAREISDTNLQNQINNIQLIPGPQGPKGDKGDTGAQGQTGPPGTINAQTCNSGYYVSGIAQGGALICTQLPSGSAAAVCGNGIPEAGEQCDSSGSDTASCNGLTCKAAVCGDGYVNHAAGEQCDLGLLNSNNPGSTYTAFCKLP